MMVTRIMAQRLRTAGMSFTVASHDLTNAFPSVMHTDLAEAYNRKFNDTNDRELFNHPLDSLIAHFTCE